MPSTAPHTLHTRSRGRARSVSTELHDGDVVRRARDVLDLVACMTSWTGAPAHPDALTARALEGTLEDAQSALVSALADPDRTDNERGRLSAVLIQAYQVRTTMREAALARRSEALSSVRGALQRLRPATTVSCLIERAPAEIGRLGYERCLVSKVDHGHWIARAAYVRNDPGMAEAIRDAGSRSPKQIDRQLIESELVRRRAPILVTDPQDNPRVHRELIDVTGTRSYVAAPFIVGRSVIGFVHVDSGVDGSVDEFDRELVGMLAEGLGFAFERAVYQERLQTLKQTITSCATSVLDLVDEVVESDLGSTGRSTQFEERPQRAPARSGRSAEIAGLLTPREIEVMELMAAGDTNGKIASTLFVTEATVKAHVKHILRKLSASNRAEAVSRYLRD